MPLKLDGTYGVSGGGGFNGGSGGTGTNHINTWKVIIFDGNSNKRTNWHDICKRW